MGMMIVRCDHLRVMGILTNPCYPDCHGPAHCVGEYLPSGHHVIYCCARIEPLTVQEVSAVLARISAWEARMITAEYVHTLHRSLSRNQEKLKEALEQRRRSQDLRQFVCVIKRIEDLLSDVGALLDG